MTLKSLLKEDETYIKFRRVCRSALANVPLQDIRLEAKQLHSSRKMRKLSSARISSVALENAISGDISVRSRLVELRVLVIRSLEVIESAVQLMRNHLRVQYSAYLDDYSGSEAGKKPVLDSLLRVGLESKSQLEALSQELELYIGDIDKSSYLATNLTNLLRMTLERKTEYV